MIVMSRKIRKLILFIIVAAALAVSGCVSCIPQYTAPPTGPVSAKYPAGHDPYIPMDHNPSPLNPWDAVSSFAAPLMNGPPR